MGTWRLHRGQTFQSNKFETKCPQLSIHTEDAMRTLPQCADAIRHRPEKPLARDLCRRVRREQRSGGDGDGERGLVARVVLAEKVVHHLAHLP